MTPVDLTNDTAGTPITLGKNPQAIAMSPDGKTAWVVCYDSETIVPLSTRTDRPGTAIKLPGGPSAIALAARPTSSPAVTPTTAARSGSSSKKKKK